MVYNEHTIWGIHAGQIGEADSLFLKKKVIAIGWQKMGNLADLKPQAQPGEGPAPGEEGGGH